MSSNDKNFNEIVTYRNTWRPRWRFYNGQLVNVPGIKADVVDTTSGGDTFNDALAVALSEGMALDDAILFANKTASISVTGLDAQGGMTYRAVMTEV